MTKATNIFGGQKIYSAFREWIPEIPAVNYGEYTAQTRDVISAVAPEYLNGSLSIEDALAQNRQPDSRSDAVTTVVLLTEYAKAFSLEPPVHRDQGCASDFLKS